MKKVYRTSLLAKAIKKLEFQRHTYESFKSKLKYFGFHVIKLSVCYRLEIQVGLK